VPREDPTSRNQQRGRTMGIVTKSQFSGPAPNSYNEEGGGDRAISSGISGRRER